MNQRTNAGYTIIANIALPDCEYVLGEKQTESKEPKYVTWYCVNNENYYYCYYTNNKNDALITLYKRAKKEINYRIDKLNLIIKGE